MQCPKIRSAAALDNYILIIEFDNNEKKQYDVSPLLNKKNVRSIEKFRAIQSSKS